MVAMDKRIELSELSLADLQSFSSKIENDVFECLTLEQTLATKSQTGGTAPERVAEALASARKLL
jgi:argininosuccinate lyase